MRPRLLCVLHHSPPIHGAAKVGDFIVSSEKIKEEFETRFVTIKSSETLGDIGNVSLKKFYRVAELYLKVLWMLLVFRPQVIYYTASVNGPAFYRDLLISTLWKGYRLIRNVKVYYHYHTKGVDTFVSASKRNLRLSRFFIQGANLILLTPMLARDFSQVRTCEQIYCLPNGVENAFDDDEFKELVMSKYREVRPLEVLFLSNMIRSKGYLHVLELAADLKDPSVHYHFAGAWQDKKDETEFFSLVKRYGLQAQVTYHGFVDLQEKQALLRKVHLMLFPTRYKAEAFGMVIIEALSFGVPVIATDEGSIPYILDEQSGIVLEDVYGLPEALQSAREGLLQKETAHYCRERFLEHFTLEEFESNLVRILSDRGVVHTPASFV